jgi:hypothetical protein
MTTGCLHGRWDEIGSSVGLLDAIFTTLFPLNRRSLFTMWLLLLAVPLLLLLAVPLLLLLAVPLLLLLAVLLALFGHG